MFYREANAISIEAIAAETLRPSYGRIEIFDKNNQSLGVRQTSPLIGTARQTIGFTRPNADIKYAIIYTDTTPTDSSPFGPFDKLRYSYPEFQTNSAADGSFRIDEVPTGTYRLTVANYPGNLIPITPNSTTPLTVTRSEHLRDLTFGYKQNLPPEILSSQFNIQENPAANSVVATVLASDPDAGQSLTYRFTSNSGPFSIDQITGEIRYTGNALKPPKNSTSKSKPATRLPSPARLGSSSSSSTSIATKPQAPKMGTPRLTRTLRSGPLSQPSSPRIPTLESTDNCSTNSGPVPPPECSASMRTRDGSPSPPPHCSITKPDPSSAFLSWSGIKPAPHSQAPPPSS
jgi:hypothetical protein